MTTKQDIWKRRVELERQEQREREALLEPLHAKFEPLYDALQAECGKIGHELVHAYFNVGGDQVLKCVQCGKTSRTDNIKELGQK